MAYEIEISGNWLENSVCADIKYPCGELVQGWECETIEEGQKLVSEWLSQNEFKPHENCVDEYCTGDS